MLKRILSTFAGIAVFIAIVMATDAISDKMYPPPPGLDFHNKEVVKLYVNSMPINNSLLLLAGYALGAFLGAIAGTIVAGRDTYRAAVLVAIAATLATTSNSIDMGHPMWFLATAGVLSIGMAALGYFVAKKREPQN